MFSYFWSEKQCFTNPAYIYGARGTIEHVTASIEHWCSLAERVAWNAQPHEPGKKKHIVPIFWT